MSTHERELREPLPLPLCLPDGRLDPRAVGYARRPLHDGALRGGWGRRKRWNYWCVTAEPWVIQITLADLDYLTLATLAVLDLRSGEAWERSTIRPGFPGQGLRMPDGVEGEIAYSSPELSLGLTDSAGGATLRGRLEGLEASFEVEVEPAQDSLNVVVPWSPTRYQLTSKHVGRAASGSIRLRGAEHAIEGFAALDYGRGRWPAHTRWNWGACAGEVEGRRIGVQLGAQWTDGTGSTENGVFLDGKLHKLGCRLRFDRDPSRPLAPWRVHSEDGRVDLRFEPLLPRPVGIRPLPRLDLAFGRYHGRLRLFEEEAEQEVEVPGLLGWAEEVRVLW